MMKLLMKKDGFDIGEDFIWQIYSSSQECSFSFLSVEYSLSQPNSGQYEINGISQVISINLTF